MPSKSGRPASSGLPFTVKAATKAVSFLQQRNENALIVLPRSDEAFSVAGFAISQAIQEMSFDQCILFLCNGGVQKAIEAGTMYEIPFIQLRYVLNLSGKLLTRLGRRRRRYLVAEEIRGPIVEGAISYFGRRIKQNTLSVSGRTLSLSYKESPLQFKVRRAIVYSKYLFLHSPMFKLFVLGELHRNGIPVTCVSTDADDVAIGMLESSLKTKNVFGFTNDTLSRIVSVLKMDVDLGKLGYRPFTLEPPVAVPSSLVEVESNLSYSRRLLLDSKTKNEPSDLVEHSRMIYLGFRRIYKLLRASSLPVDEVNYYSRLWDRALHLRDEIDGIRSKAQRANATLVHQACLSLISAIALADMQFRRRDKADRLKSLLDSRQDLQLVAWSKPEAEAVSAIFGINAISTKQVQSAEKLLFGGLWSTWRFIEIIRGAQPSAISMIGWDTEAKEYDRFKERYERASELLYSRTLEIGKRIKSV